MSGAAGLAATLWVALGSALGGAGRYWIGLGAERLLGNAFPWGTLFINIVGSFVIAYFGTLTMATGLRPAGAAARLFVMVGICGGFTTFSSFSLQTVDLLRGGENFRAAVYILASVALCLAGAMLGHHLASPDGAGLGLRT